MVPASMKVHLKKLQLLDKYDSTRPGTLPALGVVKDYVEVAETLKDTVNFPPLYATRAAAVIKGQGYAS
jgi:linoleate 10R-lipoxygenase